MQHIVRQVYLPPISERITGPASSSLEAGPFHLMTQKYAW